ncbi:lipopolysaccharide biosynthesis protein [Sphingobacterium spiritivorum]|uniref:lipopolysaccharide biosynthesis protein n=1 Tax=Sphingobacterium spiritivorum TaxID=258 RepID=UPI003DA67172
MDKRQFFINLISNLLSAFTGVGVSFFLTPYIVETLGKDAYGFFPLSSNFVMYTGIITIALNSMAARFITMSLEKKDVQEVNVYFNSVLFGNFIISGLFLLVSTVFCLFIEVALDIPVPLVSDVRLLFILVFLSLIINVSSSVFSIAAFALNRLDKIAFYNFVINILKLLVTVVLFYFFTPRIYFLGVVVLINAVYFFYVNYRSTRRLLPEVRISLSLFSWPAVFLLVGSGIWNSVMSLSNVINTQLDLLVANRFFNASGMGLLSLTKFVPTAIQLLLGIVVPVFLPELIKAYSVKDEIKFKSILSFSFKAIFLIVLVPLSIFFVYGEEFFKLWLPGQDHRTLYYISLLSLIPVVINGTIDTIYHVFVITNKLKLASFWGIFISIVNLILVICLCRYSRLGIYAIPLASLITGVLSHVTFTPLYASYCLGESRWYFLIKIANGLWGFVWLVGLTYLWKYFNVIAVNSWLSFMVNVLLIGSILFLLTLFMKFDRYKLKLMFYKFKKRLCL